MTCSGTSGCLCGCCMGTSVQTPQPADNPPGLSAIAYRVGTWATFKESMKARLSSADYPALAPLSTRSDDDFTVALLDATSVMLDVLTFYQERIANESYLRTAGQVRSLTELSRLIGYQPAPGVAASTYVAFTLKAAPGQSPDPSSPTLTIPQGSQIQSVPAQNQKPQIFETSADIAAKPDWNALPILSEVLWAPAPNDTSVYLSGTSTQLQAGDLFLIVGDERAGDPTSPVWNVRVVVSAVADTSNRRTLVTWKDPLGSWDSAPTQSNPKFHAFRQRAALYGYNSVNPAMIDQTHITPPYLDADTGDWNFEASSAGDLGSQQLIDLDSNYPKIASGSWVLLSYPYFNLTNNPPGYLTLYKATAVSTVARSDFAMAAKVSRVAVDTNYALDFWYYLTRQMVAFAQSETLAAAPQPILSGIYGSQLDLAVLRPDLVGVQAVALSGNRQKLAVTAAGAAAVPAMLFVPDDGTNPAGAPLSPGDLLTVISVNGLPLDANGVVTGWDSLAPTETLYMQNAQGRTGTLYNAALGFFALAPSGKSDPQASEYALVASVITVQTPFPHTQLQLKAPLGACYDRATTTVNANVGLATNGQSVSEIVGSGNASLDNQTFTLKQAPVTFVPAANPTGSQSTISVQVNSVTWEAVPTLYGAAPTDRVYTAVSQADGTTDLVFGDGVEGALLPSGQNNLRANYRIGAGSSGNVGAGTLTTLADRPLGVSGVTNPQPASGGQDPQTIEGIRANAPQTVLTLGRAVSIEDYQNFASTFAGIAKAYALWIPNGPGRGVFLTLAGVGGTALPSGNPTLDKLVTALQNYGNPLIQISPSSFVETLFGLSAALQYDPTYDQPTVQAQVTEALYTEYSFANRSFGQAVSVDEVAALIQGVPGVVAVNVTNLLRGVSSTAGDISGFAGNLTVTEWNAWVTGQCPSLPQVVPDSPSLLGAYLPLASTSVLPFPAELLVLDPDPKQVHLTIMK